MCVCKLACVPPVPCFEGDVRLVPEESSTALYSKLRETNQFNSYDFVNDRLRLGRVEICKDRSFTSVCNNEWDHLDASVVCSQVGFAQRGNFCSYY